jgi:Peptidase family C25
MIPLRNSEPYPFDLEENAVYFPGDQDGVFDDGDTILFYGEGVDNWSKDSETFNNLYADKSYYYVTTSSSSSKRIAAIVESAAAPTKTFTTFDDEYFYELDKNNAGRYGRKWVGESFDIRDEQDFNFSIPNIDVATPVKIRIEAITQATNATSFNIKVNGQDFGNIGYAANPTDPHISSSPNSGSNTLSFSASNASLSVKLKYSNNGVPSAKGFLDYIRINAKSFLRGNGSQYRFSVDEATSSIGTAEYLINNANSVNQVWDITDIYNVANKINSGSPQISIKSLMGLAKKYIVVDNNNLYTPLKDKDVAVYNQDLKGNIFLNNQGVFQDVDYLIITPYFLSKQAERLAVFHRNYSGLNVKAITLEAIYQEFSSGKQDIGAIRNFIKYVYDNASTASKRIKYVCFFGDASFDFKSRVTNNTNIVPIFESLNSYNNSSFISDDYFALMDTNEGNMDIGPSGGNGVDIAVGRIIASSEKQAEQLVDKVIDYHNEKSLGKWRNNVVMISDDIGRNSDQYIQTSLEAVANTIKTQKPFLNVKKIHSDSYVQEVTSGGEKYPKVNEDFNQSFETGALVIDYFGHGGEEGLASERIFEKRDAIARTNKFKYPLFITVTCEFARFDNPYRQAAGEFVFWNPDGGAVAMVTTTREISQPDGATFNTNLGSKLFSYGSNVYTSIAEAVRLTKNTSIGSSGNNVVFYLGDPALMLAIPKPKVRLTKIDDVPIASVVNPIQALGLAKITGEVTDEFDNLLTNYNGDVAVSIFDKDVNRTTLGNDGFTDSGGLIVMPFTVLGETIFRGNAAVRNGKFEFGFVAPKDIKIPVGNGKISFYAKKEGTIEDKSGYDINIKIGGLNASAPADNLAPTVKLYMNDESFVAGGITNQSPLFLAFLEDEHGINTASGIGHDIIAYLDGDETKPYVLNEYYETELDNYKKGKLKFPFKNLKVGLHTLTFKAWDVYNNLVTSELQFIVVGDEGLTLTNVLNYPNPFVNHTEFWFTHNKPFEPLEVQVQVFTITGKVVWTKNESVTTDGFLSRSITWDGKDDFGDKIGKGVYVYKLTVRSTITNKRVEKFEKLVIL